MMQKKNSKKYIQAPFSLAYVFWLAEIEKALQVVICAFSGVHSYKHTL